MSIVNRSAISIDNRGATSIGNRGTINIANRGARDSTNVVLCRHHLLDVTIGGLIGGYGKW